MAVKTPLIAFFLVISAGVTRPNIKSSAHVWLGRASVRTHLLRRNLAIRVSSPFKLVPLCVFVAQ